MSHSPHVSRIPPFNWHESVKNIWDFCILTAKINKPLSLVDDISAELDVADELALIEYVGNTKNTQSNNCQEEEIVSA